MPGSENQRHPGRGVDGQQQPTTGKIQEAEEGKATEVPKCRGDICRARHNQLCQEGQKPIQSSNLLK